MSIETDSALQDAIQDLNFKNMIDFQCASIGDIIDRLDGVLDDEQKQMAYHRVALSSVLFFMTQETAFKPSFETQALTEIKRRFTLVEVSTLLEMLVFFDLIYQDNTAAANAAFRKFLQETLAYQQRDIIDYLLEEEGLLTQCRQDARRLSLLTQQAQFDLNQLSLSKARSRRKTANNFLDCLLDLALSERSFQMQYGIASYNSSIRLTPRGADDSDHYVIPELPHEAKSTKILANNFHGFLQDYKSYPIMERFYHNPYTGFVLVDLSGSGGVPLPSTLADDIARLPFSNLKCQLKGVDYATQFVLEQDRVKEPQGIRAFRSQTRYFVQAAHAGRAATALPALNVAANQHLSQAGLSSPTVNKMMLGIATATLAFVLGASIGFFVGMCLGAWTGPGVAATSMMSALYFGAEFTHHAITWTVLGGAALTGVASMGFADKLAPSFFGPKAALSSLHAQSQLVTRAVGHL